MEEDKAKAKAPAVGDSTPEDATPAASAEVDAETTASTEVEIDPDDGKLYRIGAPWGGFVRYECLQEGCLWDTLDRNTAIEHYATAHPYTGPLQRELEVNSEGILNWKDN